MNNSALSFLAVPRQQAGWRRTGSIALVVVLHIAAIWALANGLLVNLVHDVLPPISTRVLDAPPVTHSPPPPKVLLTKPVVETHVPVPVIQVSLDPNATSIQTKPDQTPQKQTAVMIPSTPISGLAGTHTTPPYPALAHRLDQQGTVILLLTVGADGLVTDAQIVTSSGVPELDQAAQNWVMAHWRYKPATNAGAAVSGTTRAAVKFDLKDAG